MTFWELVNTDTKHIQDEVLWCRLFEDDIHSLGGWDKKKVWNINLGIWNDISEYKHLGWAGWKFNIWNEKISSNILNQLFKKDVEVP